jgi:hypothetical protein
MNYEDADVLLGKEKSSGVVNCIPIWNPLLLPTLNQDIAGCRPSLESYLIRGGRAVFVCGGEDADT